jgi:hypothetical protein
MPILEEKVSILVKALPQPSKRYGETVCCAGITHDRRWRRLFPIRFRHLSGQSSFKRWDWLSFKYERPKADIRGESCHVFEDTLSVSGVLSETERGPLLEPMIKGSGKHAAEEGHSPALIRPRNSRFVWKLKSAARISDERDAFRRAARQTSMFDKGLAELNPTPYEFRFKFEDDSGLHDYENGDWESHAMFWRESRRSSAERALEWMNYRFNEEYPSKGMVFAIGNQAKRPQTWQLLGVIRLDEPHQLTLF